MADQTDHDSLITLVADVKNLRASQDAFHKEIKESLDDLKQNYQFRLDSHEQKINDLIATRNDFRQRLNEEDNYIKLLIGVASFIGVACLGLLIYHITGFHV